MRILLTLALLLVGRAGPDTATQVFVSEPLCKLGVSLKEQQKGSRVMLEIRHELPNPGCSVKSSKATVDAKARRIRVDIEVQSKPGMWPQVTVPTKTTVDAGSLAKGRYVLEIHRGEYLLWACVLDAR